MISLTIVKLSVLILDGIGGLVHNGGSCCLSSWSSYKLIFFKMIGSFSSLISSCSHNLSMIDPKFLYLPENDFLHDRYTNSTMLHQQKSVLSNSCLCLNRERTSFSMVTDTLQNPFLLMLSPTWKKFVALGVLKVWIQLLSPSGVVELIYSSNGKWSLLTCPSNNPKDVGPYSISLKKLIWSKYLSSSVNI